MNEARRGGRRRPGLKLLLFLHASLFLNVFFFCYLVLSRHQPPPGWARSAARDAEAVAAIDCSGHGRAFLAGGDLPACECNACYSGDDCSQLLLDCPSDADSEDPLFLEPYWQQHASTSSIVLPGWQCMSSQTMGGDFISAELDRHVRLLHKAAENAITDGKFILFGSEVAELLHALVHALSADNASSSPACLVASAPHNPFGRRQHECIGIRSNYVKGSVSPATKIIEYVTSPNDPDGLLQHSVLGASAVIHDHAYFWPHYSSIPAPADEDIMLFTISKISGHAGIRLWWAVIKDQKTYQKAAEYMSLNTMVVSCDVQLRVLKLIRVVIAEMGKGGGIFEFGYKTLKTRWSKLHKLVSSSNRFSIQPLLPHYCNYFKRIRDPSPAYAWLKCETEEDKDCYSVLKTSGITSRSGTLFESNSHYTRLSLVKTEDDFDLLTMRMEALLSKELIASS
ncbi:unnamed protein product [Musa hybrid cultivar]